MKDLLSISKEKLASFKIVDWAYTEQKEPTTFKYFESWVQEGLHGPLNYLSDYRKDKRKSLNEVYPDAQSALCFLFSYSDTKKKQLDEDPKFKIASYTTGFEGQDYHYWIKEKLVFIGEALKKEFEGLEYGISLDVHPVLERDLAFRSGLGWFGKNSMIISKKHGSYTLIGSIILNQKINIESNEIELDHCGNCRKCLDACPTNAIKEDIRTIDSSLCISTFTIETFKEAPAPEGYPTQTSEIFGCDICQEVCPWNRKPIKNAKAIDESPLIDFFNREMNQIIEDIENMSNKKFKLFFKGTSFERGGKRALLKNLYHYNKVKD